MKDKINSIFKSEIIGNGLPLAISTFVKLGSGFLIAKIIALKFGVSGFGVISQLQSVLNIVLVFAGGGIVNGVVKHTAEFIAEKKHLMLSALFNTAMKIAIAFGLFASIVVILFSKQLSIFLFHDATYEWIIICIAITQIIIGLNNVMQAYINGSREVKKFSKASILGTLAGLCFFFIMARSGEITHLMIGQIGFGVFSGLFFYFFIRKQLPPLFTKTAEEFKAGKLFKYSIMLLVTVLTLPMAQIIVRNFMEQKFGWEAVGKWQGVMKISDAYLQFITIILTNYFFPKVAGMSDKLKIKKEVYKTLITIIPVTIVAAIIIFILKYEIILLLYSESFLSISDYFLFQLIGDVFKMAAYTIAYVLVAKGIFIGYVVAEFFQAICFVVFCELTIGYFGQIGITYGYALTYFIYLLFAITMLIIYTKSNLLKADNS